MVWLLVDSPHPAGCPTLLGAPRAGVLSAPIGVDKLFKKKKRGPGMGGTEEGVDLEETLGDEYNQNVSYEILKARIKIF